MKRRYLSGWVVKPALALLLSLLGYCSVGCLQAQSFSEWFKQKKTQKKYLLAQVAALQTYSQALEKGYAIASGGLSAITSVKEGDFLQHALHFSSLEMVSPPIKSYGKVMEIASLEDRSERLRTKMMATAKTKGLRSRLNTEELGELSQINKVATAEANKDLEQLQLLVTDGKLKMTDDERISLIDALYEQAKGRWGATLHLARSVQLLIAIRENRAKDIEALEALYGH